MKNSIINECWKAIVGFEGLYEVSDMGRVRSLKYGKTKILKPGITEGYYRVDLCKDGKRKSFLVHRLVVEAFIGPIPKGLVVNHLNENKLDNRLSNLEICTVTQNNNHGTRNERVAKAISKELKLTNAKMSGKYTFSSSCEANEFFGFKSKSHVGTLIFNARQRGENFINIRREKYYFSQEA